MTRGVLMIAHNNQEIDYFKIACANALMVQKNLKVPVTLITDEGTLEWGSKTYTEKFVNQCFEKVVIVHRDYTFTNNRNFKDTTFSNKDLQFYNCNHYEAYELSPYEETLFIDSDYLIMSSTLNNCWGSLNDVMINNKIYSPLDIVPPYVKNIDDMGIKLYWATVIYFRKSSLAEHLFSLVKHIQENYPYYRDLYYFTNSMFRNDYAFSIAIHMLNGFNDFESIINELPISGLLMSWDVNDIHSVRLNDMTLYVEKENEKGSYLLTKVKDTDVHIINKWAINRHSDEIISLYKV
jgi:hypothetical protein